MTKFDEIISKMKRNPRQVRFKDLCKIVIIFLENPVRELVAIGFTRLHGMEIQE